MSDQRNGGIAWTQETWNPIRGCSKVSPGCKNCYAESMAARFCGEGLPYHGLVRNGRWTGDVRLVESALAAPLRWKRARRVFVNSMSDLFHESLSNEQIAAIFGVMASCPQHTFQVLTKRAERMRDWFRWVTKEATDSGSGRFNSQAEACRGEAIDRLQLLISSGYHPLRSALTGYDARWPLPNVHLGVSCENQAAADERIPSLLQCPAAVRWVSAEPLLGPIDFFAFLSGDVRDRSLEALRCSPIPGLDWVVIGGESGHGARPMHPVWARSIRDQCRDAGVPFFFKQWGTWAPGYDDEKFTYGREETAARAQPWLRDDGEEGDCWVYDDDGTWQNHTGDPGDDMSRITVFRKHANAEHKALFGHLLDGHEYKMRPGDEWPCSV